MKKYARQLLILLLMVIVTTCCTMAWPRLLAVLVDTAIPAQNKGQVFLACGLMLAVAGVGLLCGIMKSRFSAYIAMSIGRDLRSRVFTKVISFSRSEIDRFSVSSLIARTNKDVAQIQIFLNECLAIALSAPLLCITSVIMCVAQSPSLSQVLLVAIPVIILIVSMVGWICLPLNLKIQNCSDRINLLTREKLTGVRVIRAFGTMKIENDRFDTVNHENRRLNLKSQRILGLINALLTLVLALSAAAVMYLAAVQSTAGGGDYTTGEVMAIVTYVLQIMYAVVMLTVVFLTLPAAAASARRVKEVLDSRAEIVSAEHPAEPGSVKGQLEFRDVSFTYPGSDTPAIQGLSFTAAPGETTAIIGGTGMGKTTIVNLIPRLYDVTEGSVLVDGIDVRDYDLSVLRNKIGFVPQMANLFAGTVRDNIAFGNRNAGGEEIEEAAAVAQSTDFILTKEDGFDARVAQRGSNLSGGQKQRLAIARALVRKPEIYVFDDSFSALDFKTDKALRGALKEQLAAREATAVIVAQRVSTVIDADRIIVVDAGRIMGIGKHDELMKTCPVYREIAESQLGREEAVS
ncbi:MAG: ABC transporter ATP-binding protein [Clostridia bacterium]|nr:ABC transporter ATP-binding protein [Clostridia bacterium]